ncbi:QueT transporter family protein [Caldibacillus sp. 210928-DFI.2.22]|uniref:QueT transporter family protein n=1 Tax=unclassified Caldibacillus TaxID=2641266 RepID=UPI001D08D2C1|nr:MULTISPECIES: QueT transporter family protein [unclassified Caldibacillus]MCB7070678.1 QueT transporter family protein [Caldibacillus sp. 210928-DFI.2.22]MCB7074212.1 QueT transporter family protein [Caldibacillus sp. 210928-DFI.2.18]
MKLRTITINGIVAALYIAITAVIQPIAFSNIQFRIPEIFNHLVVFNKKYFFGVVIGVFLSNLFFSTLLPYDLIFGVAHTVISLSITILLSRYIKNIWGRMLANSFIFSIMIFIVAYELKLAIGVPFWETWLLTAVGEFAVMVIGMPIMNAIYKRGIL